MNSSTLDIEHPVGIVMLACIQSPPNLICHFIHSQSVAFQSLRSTETMPSSSPMSLLQVFLILILVIVTQVSCLDGGNSTDGK